MMAKIYSIHPAIGIARVGDSQLYEADKRTPTKESYFIGPEELCNEFAPNPYDNRGGGNGKFRDRQGALRRQAARFRVFEKEIDDFGRVVFSRELTSSEARIVWSVKIANKKGDGQRFPPYYLDQIDPGLRLRNPSIQERSELVITADAKVSKGEKPKKLIGRFLGKSVKLGDVMVDDNGHLLFLGGHGVADNPTGTPLGVPRLPKHTVYNNDGWHDDTSDGWISARVRFAKGPSFEVDERAWIITAPPDHAPGIENPVTLFDVVYQANLPHHPELLEPQNVSFKRDVFPMLRRAVDLQWVSEGARSGHGESEGGNFLREDLFKQLSSNAPEDRGARLNVIRQVTPPGTPGPISRMPISFGGVDPDEPLKKPPNDSMRPTFGIPLTFTPYRYRLLELWVDGRFASDWEQEIPPQPLPDVLDRAALEACCGGSFHPGIEAPYVLARGDTFGSWFRVARDKEPGDLTQGLSVPWQTDFRACTTLWWPAQRPNSVLVNVDGQVTDLSWSRGATKLQDLLKLGFVKTDPQTGKKLEDERELPEHGSPSIV